MVKENLERRKNILTNTHGKPISDIYEAHNKNENVVLQTMHLNVKKL